MDDIITTILRTKDRDEWCSEIIRAHKSIRFNSTMARHGFLRLCLRGRGLIQDEIDELIEQFGERRK